MIKNVHGHTVEHLGEAIVAGRYAPGASIPPEPQLGEELGVSRTVVREAVKSLVAKGLLTTGPKVGTRVQPPGQWNWFDPDVVAWQTQVGLTRGVPARPAGAAPADRAGRGAHGGRTRDAGRHRRARGRVRGHATRHRPGRRLRHARPGVPPGAAACGAQPHGGADEQGARAPAAHQLRDLHAAQATARATRCRCTVPCSTPSSPASPRAPRRPRWR